MFSNRQKAVIAAVVFTGLLVWAGVSMLARQYELLREPLKKKQAAEKAR